VKIRPIQGATIELDRPKRILLGQLNSNGDCLYATTVAKQIKKDFPGCHLTWAIGSMCRSIIDGNPDVDEAWVIPLNNIGEVGEAWRKFEQEALEKKKQGVFDEIFFTHIAPGNLHHYDGTIRSSIFHGYPHQISVPVTPVLKLSALEVENVSRFAKVNRLNEKKNVILFETSPRSGQSFLTLDFAKEVANRIISAVPDCCVILSSNMQFSSNNQSIIDGSGLSLRENAELTKYCTLLVGGSSGITWCCTSDWAKPLPMIQLLKTDAFWFNSVVNDHKQWGLPSDSIIEMKECSTDRVYQCLISALLEGFDKARSLYHEKMKIPFGYYQPILNQLLNAGEFKKAFDFYLNNINRHGLLPRLILGPIRPLLFITKHRLKSGLLYIKRWIT
jgi:hypothetical protein